MTHRLSEKQVELVGAPKTKLIQDVATRWNSLYDSVNSVAINRQALTSIVNECTDVVLTQNFPSLNEFEILSEVCELLKPLKELTVCLRGSKFCTATMIFPTVYTLIHDITCSCYSYASYFN